MMEYTVINRETDYFERFYDIKEAKKAMKENNARGFKVKIYANGDEISCGEITLKGSNKSFVANSPHNMQQANY